MSSMNDSATTKHTCLAEMRSSCFVVVLFSTLVQLKTFPDLPYPGCRHYSMQVIEAANRSGLLDLLDQSGARIYYFKEAVSVDENDYTLGFKLEYFKVIHNTNSGFQICQSGTQYVLDYNQCKPKLYPQNNVLSDHCVTNISTALWFIRVTKEFSD